MDSTSAMIRVLREERGFRDATPLLLGSIYAAARLEELLYEAGIEWGSRVESVSPDKDYEATLRYGKFRRWVVFVPKKSFKKAHQLAKAAGFTLVEGLPVPFASGLCATHSYETNPCSHCDTGYDWIAKADYVEQLPPPERRASPL